MSFNKKFLPDSNSLIEHLASGGSTSFYLGYIKKVDAFIGPSVSIDFIDKFMEKYNVEDVEFFEI